MMMVDAIERNEFAQRIRRCATDLGHHGVVALAPLFDLTAPRLVRYAFTLTRNREDAEDALQAAMVRIAQRPRVLSEARHPWAYFMKMVRNEALNIMRRKTPVQLHPLVSELWTDETIYEETTDARTFVRRALRKLPSSQSEVVVLKIWEGMTFVEIGEVLGQSPNTAASRYRYALKKLTHHLQAYCDVVSYE